MIGIIGAMDTEVDNIKSQVKGETVSEIAGVEFVCGLFDVIAIFCPIRRFISVDFPTFGLPIMVTKPDLKFGIICTPFLL